MSVPTLLPRRGFLKAAVGALVWPGMAWAAELPRDLRITRIVGFDLVSRRPKLVGKNSRLDVHGDRATDRMVRLYTNTGAQGLGNCRAPAEPLARLLGKNPFDAWRPDGKSASELLGAGTMPLWDLAGRLLGKPVYELLGGAGAEQVFVYDGSIYFADLLPQYAAQWQDRLRAEVDMALEAGHRALKVKIGRGARWMERSAGDRRDVDVLRTIRGHAGKEVLVGVDANNGYDPRRTRWLLETLPDFDFAFLEEMFPENVPDYLELKRFMAERGWKTLIADGETQQAIEPLLPLAKARAVDVFQLDMNRMGLEGIVREAELVRPYGGRVAPHNWGSLVGFHMQLHVGRAVPNFYMAEHDPLANDVLAAEGYRIEEGRATVPDAPGFGLEVREAAFARDAQVRFDLS